VLANAFALTAEVAEFDPDRLFVAGRAGSRNALPSSGSSEFSKLALWTNAASEAAEAPLVPRPSLITSSPLPFIRAKRRSFWNTWFVYQFQVGETVEEVASQPGSLPNGQKDPDVGQAGQVARRERPIQHGHLGQLAQAGHRGSGGHPPLIVVEHQQSWPLRHSSTCFLGRASLDGKGIAGLLTPIGLMDNLPAFGEELCPLR
jgi:hypothetical protein